MPTEVLEQILTKADGVPLFVEELTKMVLESGLLREDEKEYTLAGKVIALEIPMTLQDSLMARLDRLASAKELVQLCSILGREFPFEMLLAIQPHDKKMLQKGLEQLVESELLYQRGVFPKTTFIFKHALIQETAYRSMLKNTRRRYHRKIGEVLVKQFSELATAQPEVIAHHFSEAGLTMRAVSYWQQAGQHAAERFANNEAIAHFTKALELLKDQPENPEHTRQELMLQLAMGPPLSTLKGFAAPEVEAACSRAFKLCEQVGGALLQFPALWGLWHYYLVKSDFPKAVTLSKKLLGLAQTANDHSFLSDAYRAIGETFLWSGEFSQANEYFEKGIDLTGTSQQITSFAESPDVSCRFFSAIALWFLGYPDQALWRSREAITCAQQLNHPFSLSAAHHFASWLHLLRRESQLTREHADTAMAIAADQGFMFFIAFDTMLKGWAMAEKGQMKAGVSLLREGLAAFQATGTKVLVPQWMVVLAELYGMFGQIEEALSTLAEAQILSEKNSDERYFIVEMLRLKGQLLVQRKTDKMQEASDDDESETHLLNAIKLAQQQEAKSLELRAAISLSRIWQSQGKKPDAFNLLSEIYGWFEEGLDTPDLIDAKVLLEELS